MIVELSIDIKNHVFEKLDEIYNHRKRKAGLVSCHNMLIHDLKKKIDEWVDEQRVQDAKIQKLINQLQQLLLQ